VSGVGLGWPGTPAASGRRSLLGWPGEDTAPVEASAEPPADQPVETLAEQPVEPAAAGAEPGAQPPAAPLDGEPVVPAADLDVPGAVPVADPGVEPGEQPPAEQVEPAEPTELTEAVDLRAELARLLDAPDDGPPAADGAPGDDLIDVDLTPEDVAAVITSAPIARARAAQRDEPVNGEAATGGDTPIGEIAAAAVRALNPGGRFDFPRPPRRRILTVANQKGGVGKTTTTVNLAAALALHGSKVLVLDLDPQGNASTGLGVEHHSGVAGVYDVLIDGLPIADVVQQAQGVPNLWCVPATIDLAGAEIELVSVVARESRLKRAIDAFLDGPGAELDYVLVDCPPSLGLLTVNAMVATEELLIPIQCEYYALEGLGQLLKNVELVRGHLNPALHVSTILLTMYDARTKLADQVREEVRSHFGDTVLATTIPRSVRVSEAPGYGQSVVTYDPGSRGSLAYLDAAREIAERGAAPTAQEGDAPT